MSKEKIKYTTKLLDAITNKISKAKQMQAPWQAPWQAQANIAMNAKVQEQQANQEPSLQDVTQL
jgi:predicted  nucleic acid-binding Zn ribbon protein